MTNAINTLSPSSLPTTTLSAPAVPEQATPGQPGTMPAEPGSASSGPPGDIATWLLGDPAAATEAGAVVVAQPRARLLGQLGEAARESLGRQVVTALKGVIGEDPVELLRAGWARNRALLTAATETADHAHAEQLVQLAEHQVTFSHEPTVDMLLNKIEILVLTAKVEVIFDIGRVEAVVRSGRLVSISAGDAKVTGSVSVEDKKIVQRTFDLPLELAVELGGGIDLRRALLDFTG